MPRYRYAYTALLLAVALVGALPADASSHREAPAITKQPKVDATDFYMFRSYEAGRDQFVTIVACYQPLQDPYGGPNYFLMDEDAVYEIHIDNNGDAREDLTFQFRFQNTQQNLSLPVGDPGSEVDVEVPVVNLAPFGVGNTAGLNVIETYNVTLITGDRRTGTQQAVTQVGGGANFTKPHDNIGNKTIVDYASYSSQFFYDITIPGCPTPGRMFVGQRKDPFVVNLGEVFDLVNTNPLGTENGEADDLADKNITAICLELPIACLTAGDPVIGGWTTASLRQARVLNPAPGSGEPPSVHGGALTQVSRLASPLVNEVVIGLSMKDRFNASEPKDDAQFATFVTNPTLPEIIQVLFPVTAPDAFPRQDLVQVFLTGVPGLNQPGSVQASEMQRLNTTTPIVARGAQNRLGVIAGDAAGYPNGRRPGDDVVDISLRVVMGVLLPPADAPSGALAFTDGAFVDDSFFLDVFPYLQGPIPGSPN